MKCIKIRHSSRLCALRHAVSLMQAGKARMASEYRCRYCKGWHVTSKPQTFSRL